MSAYHAETERLIEAGPGRLGTPQGHMQLMARAGVLEYLAARLRTEAAPALAADPEFTPLARDENAGVRPRFFARDPGPRRPGQVMRLAVNASTARPNRGIDGVARRCQRRPCFCAQPAAAGGRARGCRRLRQGPVLPAAGACKIRGLTLGLTNLARSRSATRYPRPAPPAPQSCLIATVFSTENPYSASKPFSRPWPECFTPPKGSSMPPPAP